MQHLTLSALFLPWGAGGVELTAMPISEPGKATAPILMAAEIVSPALWRVHGDALAAVKASRNGDGEGLPGYLPGIGPTPSLPRLLPL